jgi:hypothetical protein
MLAVVDIPPLASAFSVLLVPLLAELAEPVAYLAWGAEIHSCSSSVLVQEPAEQIAPTDLTLADDTNAIGIGGRTRRSQPERPVGPMHVVVLHIDAQDLLQVAASHDQQPVQTLGADRADPALRGRVGVGRLDRCQDYLGALRAEEVVEGAAELGVTIAEQELDSSSLLAEHQQQVPRLLRDPNAVGLAVTRPGGRAGCPVR